VVFSLTWALETKMRCSNSAGSTLLTYPPSLHLTPPLLRRSRTLPCQGTSPMTLSRQRLERDQSLWKKPLKEEGLRKGSSLKTANRKLGLAAHYSHHPRNIMFMCMYLCVQACLDIILLFLLLFARLYSRKGICLKFLIDSDLCLPFLLYLFYAYVIP
jgi:hypothetical protein